VPQAIAAQFVQSTSVSEPGKPTVLRNFKEVLSEASQWIYKQLKRTMDFENYLRAERVKA